MNHCRTCVLALILPLAVAAAASGLVLVSGANDTAPATDPGWANVGSVNGLSAVYLGGGWVLTANHVGPGAAAFGGTLYPWVPGVSVRLDDSLADLRLFKIAQPFPALPALSIRKTSPPLGTSLVLIGYGLNRGAETTWSGHDGYLWGGSVAKRWGTNDVENVNANLYEPNFGTELFGTRFDDVGPPTPEAQGAPGDSGGAVFAGSKLAGIMVGILEYQGQPDAALFGNATLAADLSEYRNEIDYWMPEPTGGLWTGAALVAALARARRVSAPSSPGSPRTSDRAR